MAEVIYIEVEEPSAEHEVQMIWRTDSENSLTGSFVRYLQHHGLS